MPNAVEFSYFSLKNGSSVSDFLLVSDKFNRGFLSKQKGSITRKLLCDSDIWADNVLWETMEDVRNAFKAADEDAIAREYLSFM